MTDRYTRAIEQLGSKELDVRIGGIYALERIARDSARDHPPSWKSSPPSSASTHTSGGRHQIPAAMNRNDRYGPMFRPPSPCSDEGTLNAIPSPLTSAAPTARARISTGGDLAGANLVKVTLRGARPLHHKPQRRQ